MPRTTFGVSGFQIQFSSQQIHTPGDAINAMVAMNPAAFKMNISDVEPGGIVIANEDEFTKLNLKKAGYAEGEEPLDDEEINRRYQLFRIPISRRPGVARRQRDGVEDIDRCRNMYAWESPTGCAASSRAHHRASGELLGQEGPARRRGDQHPPALLRRDGGDVPDPLLGG